MDGIRDRIVELRRVPASVLRANPKNWRTHPESQRSAMAGILAEVGYADALLVRQTPAGLELIDGHLRAETTPDQEVPVLVLDVNEAEADMILATHDPLAGMAETDASKLRDLLSGLEVHDDALRTMLEEMHAEFGPEPMVIEDPGAQIDRAEELREKWGVERGQVCQLGRHRVMCGDATSAEDVEALLAGTKPVTAILDPPYGISLDTDYATMPKTRRGFDPIEGDGAPFDAAPVRGLLAGIAEQFWFGADYYAHSLGDTEHTGAWLVWDKRVEERYDTGFGSAFELIWASRPRKRAILRVQWFQNHAENPTEAMHRRHPTQKPTTLVVTLLDDVRKGDVYDPFLGSGTTLVACEQLGRIGYGMEISPGYVAVSLERLAGMGSEPHLA